MQGNKKKRLFLITLFLLLIFNIGFALTGCSDSYSLNVEPTNNTTSEVSNPDITNFPTVEVSPTPFQKEANLLSIENTPTPSQVPTPTPTPTPTSSPTNTPTPTPVPTPTPTIEINVNDSIDFLMHIKSGKDIKILQLTDTQLVDLSQTRNSKRYASILKEYPKETLDMISNRDLKCYSYIRELVEKTSPDLIVLTGDLIYGETDDSGALWQDIVSYMDTLHIPWALTFGNHDNESAKGVLWQIEVLKKSKYCLFNRGNVTGNSNYNIVLEQDGKYKYIVYLLDTNGCKETKSAYEPESGLLNNNPDYSCIKQELGIFADQIEWYRTTAKNIAKDAGETIPSLTFFHIPVFALDLAGKNKYGFDRMAYPAYMEGDFGNIFEITRRTGHVDRNMIFYNVAKDVGTLGMFFGHDHVNSASIVYDGIRITYGLKTGTYSYYRNDSLGGTLITINNSDNTFDVKHVFCEKKATN